MIEKTPTCEILLIEDNLILQRCEKMLLQNHGCEVMSVSTKQAALNQIKSVIFDVLLVDIGLPDGSGWEVVEYCRESINSQNPLTPIVVVSAHVQPSESEKYRQQYPSLDVILKPLSEEKIYRILSTLILDDGENDTSVRQNT